MRCCVALILLVLGFANSASAQYFWPAVTRATLDATALRPGDNVTVRFELAPGAAPVSQVIFSFTHGTRGRAAVANNPSNGVATIAVDSDWPDGTYSGSAIVLFEGDLSYLYRDDGPVPYTGASWKYANPATAVKPSSLQFTVSGGIATPVAPTMVEITRTSPETQTAGSPLEYKVRVAAGTTPRANILLFVTGPEWWPIVGGATDVRADGLTDIIVSIPTGPTWTNGEYRVTTVSVTDPNGVTRYDASASSGSALIPLTTRLTGGVTSVISPDLLSVRRASAAVAAPGQTISIPFTVTPGSDPLTKVSFEFEGPGGIRRHVSAETNVTTATAVIDPTWLNGEYRLRTVTLNDDRRRASSYWRDGFGSDITGATRYSPLPFAELDFTITGATSIPPHVTRQPVDVTVTPGSSAQLSFGVESIGPLAITWYQGEVGDTSRPINRNSSELAVGELSSTARFWARITSGTATTDTNAATATVVYSSTMPAILRQPAGFSAVVGASRSLKPWVVGPAPLTFQWYRDDIALPGATAVELSFSNGQAAQNGTYVLVATNSAGSVRTDPVTVSFVRPPQWATVPQDQTVAYGGTLTLSARADGGAVSYQWRRGTVTLAGGSDGQLTLTDVQPNQAGTYTVRAWNAAGTIETTVNLTVTGGPLPVISAATRYEGTVGHDFHGAVSATNSPTGFTAEGLPPGLAIGPQGGISGRPTTAGTYPVTITATNNQGSRSTSTTFVIAPGVTIQPSPDTQSIPPGATATLTVSPSGQPIAYQWYRGVSPDMSDPVAGATAATLTTGPLSQTTLYWVRVTFAGPSIGDTYLGFSTNAVVTVAAAPVAPMILTQPVAIEGVLGGTARFAVVASGSDPLRYQWQKDGVDLPGGNAAELVLAALTRTHAGLYRVRVSNVAGERLSQGAELTLPPEYPGTYFGSGPDGSSWALLVRADLSGVFVGYRPATRDATVTRVEVAADGTFAASTASALALAPRVGASVTALVSGRITATSVIGLWAGGAITGAGDGASGYPSPYAGYYEARGLDSVSGASTVVVGPSGRAFVLVQRGNLADAVGGWVDGMGGILATTLAGVPARISLAAGYGVQVTLEPAQGPAVTFYGLSDRVAPTGHLGNVSVRAQAGTGDKTLIVGFVIGGANAKQVLVRGVGPGLQPHGVAGFLRDPRLTLHDQTRAEIAANDNWGGGGTLTAAFNRVYAFPLPAGSADAALLRGLPPGLYTAQASAASGEGVVLVEAYEADELPLSAGRFANFSVRSHAGTAEQTLTAGFVVVGNSPRRLLIRAVGPGLIPYQVGGTIADPKLSLFREQTVLAGNDNWDGADETIALFNRVGAFPLAGGSRDAALIMTLMPGSYTVQATGADGSSGVALIEVYEID